MSENGGPTTQSGTYFQNTVAAWFMAQMYHDATRGRSENRVVRVRCEAPTDVDDVVVTFERGIHYVQAKEALSASGKAWTGLWRHFWKQLDRMALERDRLVLWGGQHTDLFKGLQAMTRRAQSVPPAPRRGQVSEFIRRLTQKQLAWLDGIVAIICDYEAEIASAREATPGGVDVARSDVFELLRVVDVVVKGSAEEIKEQAINTFLSDAADAATTFATLRDLAADKARTRGSWDWEALHAVLVTRQAQSIPGAPGMPEGSVELDGERESLERELTIHQRNLRKLREQKAIYGAGAAPLHLLNQIEHEQQMIRDIERSLGR